MSDLNDVRLEDPSDEHIKALLSKVAYENVSAGFDFNNLDGKFSVAEKNYLANNFRVIDAVSNYTGLRACWLEKLDANKNPTGEVTYAIAGTDEFFLGGLFDYGDDYDICKKGMATEQFIEAYNYYMRMANPEGDIINQIVEGKPESGAYLKIPTLVPGVYEYYTVIESINTNTTGGFSNISLTGHSLGGHLAGLLGMITGYDTTIFNAPSYFKNPIGDYSIEYTFIDNDGVEHTETLASDYLGFIEKFFGSDLNQSSITHIYNSNNLNVIANLGWNWNKNEGVDCLNQSPELSEAHSIISLCDAYYTHEIIKDFITNSNVFFQNVAGTNSQIAFENLYKLYCLENNKSFTEINYASSDFQNTYLTPLKNWLDEQIASGKNILSDVFNDSNSSSFQIGNDNVDIIYTGGGNDTVNAGGGNDTVYGGDFFNNAATNDSTKNIDLGSGKDKYYGGDGKDIVRSSSGENTVRLAGGNDTFIGGSGVDKVFGGSGNNEIHLGRDKTSDVYFSNVTNGEVDVVWNSTKDDYIILAGGIREQETKGNDLYIYGKNGGLIILKERGEDEEEEEPNGIYGDDEDISFLQDFDIGIREIANKGKLDAESQASPLVLDLDGEIIIHSCN